MNTVTAMTPTVIEVITRGPKGDAGLNGASGDWATLANKPTTLAALGIPASEFPGGAPVWSDAPPDPAVTKVWGNGTNGAIYHWKVNSTAVGAWIETP